MALSLETIAKHKLTIDTLSHYNLACLWRNAPVGHIYFDVRQSDIPEYFRQRFQTLGGMTPELSKAIGYDNVP